MAGRVCHFEMCILYMRCADHAKTARGPLSPALAGKAHLHRRRTPFPNKRRRALERGMPPYRVLGLTARATNAEIKAAYKKLAMKWHPDAHHGAAKAQAEEKFKTILGAYQALTGVGGAQQQQQQQQQQYYYDVASRRRGRTARGGHNWGSAEAFGHAGNPHESYMGFGPGGKHWCALPLG